MDSSSPPSGHTNGASTRSSASSPAEDTHFEGKAELKNERPPRFSSPYMDQLFIDDPPIDLQGPGSSTHQNYMGCDPCPTMLLLASGECLPATLEQNKIGIKLGLQAMGGTVAKRLVISAKIGGANIKKLHDTRTEFYFGVPGHIRNLLIRSIGQDSLGDTGAENTFTVSWDTVGGIGIGLGVSRPEFDPETRRTLRMLRVLSGSTEEEPTSIKMVVAASEKLRNLLDQSGEGPRERVPWSPYCDNLMRPRIGFDDMQSREAIDAKTGGLFRYPARNAFASVTEAAVALAYGIMLEYRQAPLHNSRHAWPGCEHNESYLEQIMLALGKVFQQGENGQMTASDRSVWQEMILNQRPDLHPMISPTRVVGRDWPASSDMETVLSCYDWSPEQTSALQDCNWMTTRVGIIEGHTGSGKTQLLAGMAAFYALRGLSVLVCAPSPATAKAFSGLMRDLLRRLHNNGADELVLTDVLEVYPFEPVYDELKDGEEIDLDEVKSAKILVTTPNFICCKPIRAHFGSCNNGIVVLHDESQHTAEAEILATIFGLDHHRLVRGLLMAVDTREWPMDVMTETDPVRQFKREKDDKVGPLAKEFFFDYFRAVKERTLKNKHIDFSKLGYRKGDLDFYYGRNEFGSQAGLALGSRLLRQQFPSWKLTQQHRVSPQLMHFPEHRAYASAMIKRRQAQSHPSQSAFSRVFMKWLGRSGDERVISSAFLKASPSHACHKARHQTESKSNLRNVDVVADLFIFNKQNTGVNPKDIKIITPYSDQRRCYLNKFKELGSGFPEVFTIDAMRGQQAPIIIYDLVVTCGDSSHGIGIVADEFRANMVATRATDMFVIVGSESLLRIFPEYWRGLMKFCCKPKEPLPYIVEYIEHLDKCGLSFSPRTPYVHRKPYRPPKHLHKNQREEEAKGEHQGSWEKTAHHTHDYDRGYGQ